MSNTVNGTVKIVGQTQQITDKFKKRDLIVTDSSSKYPQDIKVEFLQDDVSKLDSVKEGDEVEVAFNLRGRAANNGEYYNTLAGWKITVSAKAERKTGEMVPNEAFDSSDDSDLPF